MKVKVFKINAFVSGEIGGNPAGVVLDSESLSPEQMQKVAKITGYSETAFISKSNKADYKVRFFTPTVEVPLCGHATISAYFLLNKLRILNKNKATHETSVGVLDLRIEEGFVFMEQLLPVFSTTIDQDEVLKCLGISKEKLVSNLPIEIVSTGFPSIMIPINSLLDLKNIKIDLERSRKLCDNKLLFHPFTLESVIKESIAFSRNFMPDITEDEDAATGTSTGALASYLFKHDILTSKTNKYLNFDQGNFMDRPSKLIAKLDTEGKEIKKIWVGGKCILTEEFYIEI